jgi:MFS family permease
MTSVGDETSTRTPLGTNYWKLWSASVVSNFGDGVSTVAYPWLASAVTRDPIAIAGVAVATRLPWLVFSLPAGVITDRVDRRKLVAWMDVVRCLITLGVALVVLTGSADLTAPADIGDGLAEVPANATLYLVVLYLAALAFGFAEVLRDNAAQTLMPSIVAPESLERANGRLWGAEMVMNSFAGPPLGGLLIAVAFALPFFVDAGTFAIAAALVFAIGGRFVAGEADENSRPAFRRQLSEGVQWLWRHRLLRSMGLILGVMNAMIAMALATYVLFVQEILGLQAARFGALLTAGALGGVIGSFTAAKISSRIGPGASLFTTLLVSAGTALATGLTSSALVVWVMFVLSSFVSVLWNVITVAFRQSIIPDRLLGRVNSVYRFFAWGMMPLGSLLGGIVVSATESLWGRDLALRMPFLLSAGVWLILFFYALPVLNTPRLDQARAEADARTQA